MRAGRPRQDVRPTTRGPRYHIQACNRGVGATAYCLVRPSSRGAFEISATAEIRRIRFASDHVDVASPPRSLCRRHRRLRSAPLAGFLMRERRGSRRRRTALHWGARRGRRTRCLDRRRGWYGPAGGHPSRNRGCGGAAGTRGDHRRSGARSGFVTSSVHYDAADRACRSRSAGRRPRNNFHTTYNHHTTRRAPTRRPTNHNHNHNPAHHHNHHTTRRVPTRRPTTRLGGVA